MAKPAASKTKPAAKTAVKVAAKVAVKPASVTRLGKGDLIDKVVANTKLGKKEVAAVISETLNVIVASVKSKKTVTLPGFGTFASKRRAARTGRNPSTGEVMKIKAKTVPSFSAGQTFKNTVA